MKVETLMKRKVAVAHPKHTAAQAAEIMEVSRVGSLPVMGHDGSLLGIVTDRDIALRCSTRRADPALTRVEEIMSRGVTCCYADEEATAAARRMADDRRRRLVVLDRLSGRLVGLLSVDDLAVEGDAVLQPLVAAVLRNTRHGANARGAASAAVMRDSLLTASPPAAATAANGAVSPAAAF